MKVLINKYRGFEIEFNPDVEKFTYSIDTLSWHEKQSYAACKKSIDDYLKLNSNFKPFYVREVSNGKVKNIVGLRKDHRFIYDENGEHKQMSNYEEDRYVLENKSLDIEFVRIADLESQMEDLRLKITEIVCKIRANNKSLESYKKELIETL